MMTVNIRDETRFRRMFYKKYFEWWKQRTSKCYWIKKKINLFHIHPSISWGKVEW